MKLAVIILVLSVSGIILFTQPGMEAALSCVEMFLDLIINSVNSL